MSKAKPYKVTGFQFGRDWDSWTEKFAALDAAAEYVKGYWQGEDFRDSDTGFHTDMATFEVEGFTLTEIGLGREVEVKTRACQDDSCEMSHCRKCGCHMAGDFFGAGVSYGATCETCDREAREAWEVRQ